MKTTFTQKALSMAAAAAVLSAITSTAYAYNGNYDYLFTYDDDSVTAATDDDGAADEAAYTIDGTTITIKGIGTYVVTGSSENGSISVKKDTDGVTLIFEDLTLSYTGDTENTDTVTVGKNSTVDIVIEGDNTVTNSNDDGAAIKIKSGASVTITGDGTLEVDASEGNNGIKGAENATLTIGEDSSDSFTLTVSAANNGVASDGSIVVNGGTVNITSDGDGLKSSPDEDDTTSEGTMTINNGTLNITSGEDGVQADGGFTMNDGTLNIVAGGGSANASNLDEDTSAKGIKSDSYIMIAGGDISIDAADDGIHLNGTTGSEEINITSGTLTIASGDDGIKSDYTLNIGTEGSDEGPTVNITKSCEGLEGTQVNLYSGTGTITASDDGINAANSDLTNGDFDINISGGTWTVNANGDGLDSNGDITVTGGDTTVFGAANDGNAALDVGDNGGKLTVVGGSLTGIGMSGMAIAPSSGTYVQFGSSGMGGAPGQSQTNSGVSIAAGSTIEIKDASGNTVYSTTAAKSANSILYASDELSSGSTYTLYINGKSTASTMAAEGNGFTGAMGMSGAPGGMPGDQNGQQPPEMQGGFDGQQMNGQAPDMQNGFGGQQIMQSFQPSFDDDFITITASAGSDIYTNSDIRASVPGFGTFYSTDDDIVVISAVVNSGDVMFTKEQERAAGKIEDLIASSTSNVTFDEVETLFDSIGFEYKGNDILVVNGRYVIRGGWSKDAVRFLNELMKKGIIKLTDNSGREYTEVSCVPASDLSLSGLKIIDVTFEIC